jgi:hypothetical protein
MLNGGRNCDRIVANAATVTDWVLLWVVSRQCFNKTACEELLFSLF